MICLCCATSPILVSEIACCVSFAGGGGAIFVAVHGRYNNKNYNDKIGIIFLGAVVVAAGLSSLSSSSSAAAASSSSATSSSLSLLLLLFVLLLLP